MSENSGEAVVLASNQEGQELAELGSTVHHHKVDDRHLLNDRFVPN